MKALKILASYSLWTACLATAVLLLPATSSAQPACASGTTVSTTGGAVCGFVFNGVNEWLGIPYAAPPVGPLRWQPPQPAASWTGTRTSTAYGNICTQAAAAKSGPNTGSEDCLYVNVWAPPGAKNLPVMAHIHGGGFFKGSGNGDNTLLVNTGNVVVVSMNYRLNIFGFMVNRNFGHNPGNYGLADQQAALRWVQENVAAFGGDPDNVTIFGESAGGSSVCHQIASPTAAGLFQKGISTSGEYNTLFGIAGGTRPGGGEDLELQDCKSQLPSLAQAETIGDAFATALGCTGSGSAVVSCLQAVAPQAVSDISSIPGSGYSAGAQGTVAPTIDGKILPRTLREALETGHVNRVPVIAGTGRDENLVGFPATPSDYTAIIQNQYPSISDRVLALYPLSHFNSPFVAYRTVSADSNTVCSALRTAEELSRWMPVFEYQVDYGDPWPQVFTGESTGAAHVAAWVLTPVAGLDVNQMVLQNQELLFVTNFARGGNPSGEGVPVWPEFKLDRYRDYRNDSNPDTRGLVMSLNAGGDSQKTLHAQTALVHHCDFWDSVTPKPQHDGRW